MKSPFVIAGIIVIGLVIGIFWSWPSYQAFLALLGQQKQKAAELNTQTNYFGNLKSLDEKLHQFPEKLAAIDWALPNDPSLPSLYGEIQAMAANSGLVLRSISSSVPPSSGAKLQAVDVILQASGSYSGLKEFLARVQSAPRVLKLHSAAFSYPKTGNTFTFDLRLEAYSY